MQLLLVRHGQTRSNVEMLLDTAHPGAPLDETGHAQAAALAGRLAVDPVDGIYASDLTRTRQTAAPLAAARGITPVVLPGLREIQAGDDELSVDWTRYVAALGAWRDDPSVRIPGGENGIEFMTRFDEAVGQVASAGHASAVLFTHGAALR
ncbi:MAG TPA: histidine phosphatase family protein, partial [Candidatus Lustribacter sp.]|nr:histidine phosphatase family protein [Candidatus Lustribacter sp.]